MANRNTIERENDAPELDTTLSIPQVQFEPGLQVEFLSEHIAVSDAQNKYRPSPTICQKLHLIRQKNV